jgi:hypothetical protein
MSLASRTSGATGLASNAHRARPRQEQILPRSPAANPAGRARRQVARLSRRASGAERPTGSNVPTTMRPCRRIVAHSLGGASWGQHHSRSAKQVLQQRCPAHLPLAQFDDQLRPTSGTGVDVAIVTRTRHGYAAAAAPATLTVVALRVMALRMRPRKWARGAAGREPAHRGIGHRSNVDSSIANLPVVFPLVVAVPICCESCRGHQPEHRAGSSPAGAAARLHRRVSPTLVPPPPARPSQTQRTLPDTATAYSPAPARPDDKTR